MESFVRRFIRSALVWLAVGVLLGISFTFWPADHLIYRPAHMHANLVGFVSMMIFGVAYHVMPRFVGTPLFSRRLAGAHLWLANLGLGGMVGGWLLRPTVYVPGTIALQVGSVLTATGFAFFILNIWKTLDVPKPGLPASSPLARAPLVQIGGPEGGQRAMETRVPTPTRANGDEA